MENENNKKTIKQWAQDDRPREKFLLKGPEALSDSELLAILIKTGTQKKSAVDLGKDLLNTVKNNLNVLGKMTIQEIVALKISGIGKVKATTIKAALELGIRRDVHGKRILQVTSSKDIAIFLQSILQYKKIENFIVVYLNRAHKILHYEIISEGGITATIVDIRVVLQQALAHQATELILSHNHPSGNLQPSKQDIELTIKIKEAAGYLDIKILDHIIVSDEGYYSFADDGRLD